LHQVAQSNIGVVPLFRLLVACTMVQLPPWSPAPTRWSSEAVQFRLWHFSVWGAAKGPATPTTEKEYIAYLRRGSTRRTTPRLWKADKGFRSKFNVSEEAREVSLKSVMHRLLRGKL